MLIPADLCCLCCNITVALRQSCNTRERVHLNEEPMLGVVHGWPGTGKGRVINWFVGMFTEGVGWKHGVEFLCLAFPNRVAYAMGGSTIHTAGYVAFGGSAVDKTLGRTKGDKRRIKNRSLRWLLTGEVWQIPDNVLIAAERNFSEASEQRI